MDVLGLDSFQMDQLFQSDLAGSFQQNLDVDNGFLGKLFPGDTWDFKENPSTDALDDLLGSRFQYSSPDPLGQEWMENSSNLEQLLGLDGTLQSDLEPEFVQTEAVEENKGDISIGLQKQDPVHVVKTESKKASQILHDLLTAPIQQVSKANDSIVHVPDFLELMEDSSATVESNEFSAHVEPEILMDSFSPADVKVESLVSPHDMSDLYDQCANEIMKSPLSADEVESLLSTSEPPSPDQSVNSDPDYLPSDDEYQPKSKSKSKSSKKSNGKSRAVPYDIPSEGLSKKERKKLQNKNAAIRYRTKKREEMNDIKSEENVLLDRNRELKDKVETLQREIKYMKDLMTEVFKAKGLKITFKSSE